MKQKVTVTVLIHNIIISVTESSVKNVVRPRTEYRICQAKEATTLNLLNHGTLSSSR